MVKFVGMGDDFQFGIWCVEKIGVNGQVILCVMFFGVQLIIFLFIELKCEMCGDGCFEVVD